MQQLTSQYWNFDEDPILRGYFVSSSQIVLPKGDVVTRHSLARYPSGELVSFLGSYQLNPALEKLKIGTPVGIEYLGQTDTNQGNRIKKYRVEAWLGEVEEFSWPEAKAD